MNADAETTFDVFGDGIGRIGLEQACASDLMVVNAARVSFGQRSEEMGEAEVGLINFLMRERHGSPFEHNLFTFHVVAPIFVAREWMRHRIGSYNEYSGRYRKMQPRFYVPSGDALRTQVGKPGSYSFDQLDEVTGVTAQCHIRVNCEDAWDKYEAMLESGVAKEVARQVLPLNLYTEFYWTVNARALMNFLSLRNSDAALLEIRAYAELAEVLFGLAMPITHAAFFNSGRQTP